MKNKTPMLRKLITLCLFSGLFFSAFSQNKYTISGHLKDRDNGEDLINAVVYVNELKTGAVTNLYGFYSLTLDEGEYNIQISYLGFKTITKTVTLDKNITFNYELEPVGKNLETFVVEAEAKNKNVESVEMSTVDLKMETIKKLPAFLGEVDIIKTLQLLPGVQNAGEGTGGFFVRGGDDDQNLILLDEAAVYNASHLLGFFSVFNGDAIKDLKLYKGGIPAEYGGRLASVLDIRMKDGNSKKLQGTGGIGTISSRLTLEAPLDKEGNGSFIISGRRTYADLFLKLSSDPDLRNNQLYFYDLNAKANYTLDDKNRIYLSGYFGRDVFSFSEGFGMNWGNTTGTARWNHIFNNRLFSNVTLIYSDFDYLLGASGGTEGFEWKSNIQDFSTKLDFNYFLNTKNTIKFGAQTTLHTFNPGDIRAVGGESIFNDFVLNRSRALEHGIYISNEQKVIPRLTALYGIRYSLFQNLGEATTYSYNSDFTVRDTTQQSSGVYHSQGGFEPRLGLKYTLNDESSVKASYNLTRQYVQMASNSTASSPLDIWFPASSNVNGQISNQVALGYFRNLKNNAYELSVETYYKKMNNTIDFKDHASLLFNRFLEGELRVGESQAYGLEFMLRKQEGKFNGWISYTLSRTERKIPGINNGQTYLAPYDKTHDISVVGSYELNDKWNFSSTWVYVTGAAVTMPSGSFTYGGITAPVYTDRNAVRLPAYHRLDLAATLIPRKNAQRKLKRQYVFSVYNAYNRYNTFNILFEQNATTGAQEAQNLYLFPILPSVTVNFNF